MKNVAIGILKSTRNLGKPHLMKYELLITLNKKFYSILMEKKNHRYLFFYIIFLNYSLGWQMFVMSIESDLLYLTMHHDIFDASSCWRYSFLTPIWQKT